MSSRPKFFSWSKVGRQSSEPQYRTGGLLAIDTTLGDTDKEPFSANEAKSTPQHPRPGKKRPPNLNLTIPRENHSHYACLTPASAHHSAALVNSASNLLAVVNDMLRSPALTATICPRTATIHKPLPSRPRSQSLPATPDLPAELPGSILQENQGLPTSPVAGPARHTMRSVRSGNSLGASAAAKSNPSKVPLHKKSLSETSLQRRSKSKPNLVTSPTSTACSVSTNGGHASSADSTRARVGQGSLESSPLIIEGKPWKKSGEDSSTRRNERSASGTSTPSTRNKQIEELKSTITAQDQTISTLQAQFSGLRVSHEAHVASLVDAHAAELATLRNYTQALEEQQSQRTLHHASSNHLLLLLDTTEPQTPSRELSPQTIAASGSATSARSFQTAFEQQTRSPQSSRDSSDMESLKRKLSAAKRPETGNRELIRELNTYKQNNAALQKQIESLMSKLNQSKKNERSLAQTVDTIEKAYKEIETKAAKAESLQKSSSALQNTIDHLEHRLEIANCDKLDAEELLSNYLHGRDPFDPSPRPSAKILEAPRESERPGVGNGRHSAHTSMSTVFSSGAAGSPTSHVNEMPDPVALSAFISHIERLQEQLKQRDVQLAEREQDNARLKEECGRLRQGHKELNLQLDIQAQLLEKTKNADVHIEELRTKILDREAIIGEKEQAMRMLERQLEHHKLLLKAEVRRHATIALLADVQDDPLPDLTSLTSNEAINRWIMRLQNRLKKEKAKRAGEEPAEQTNESQIESLKKEVEFYIREIIYYKLDIKGYKSDIRKLKHMAARIGSYGSRSFDVESPTSSLGRSADTPLRTRFSSGTPNLGFSTTPSPISTGPVSATLSVGRPTTPPNGLLVPDPVHASPAKSARGNHKRFPRESQLKSPATPHTPTRQLGKNPANEADNMDPGISPRSVARLSPERRKPTPPSPDQEKFGEMATNFPLSTPAAPKRHDTQRSNSDSIIQLYATPRTPQNSPTPQKERNLGRKSESASNTRGRSMSASEVAKEKVTPDRPPRPRYGLFDTPTAATRDADGLPIPPRINVMAEAMRNSPDRVRAEQRPQIDRQLSDPTISRPRGLSTNSVGSSGSGPAIPHSLSLRPRGGSSESGITALVPSAQRKGSAGSGSNIPFVIAMGSPHNPALISPTIPIPPAACSITGKHTSSAPLKVQPHTNRAGVGGTMASSTPLTSPVSPIDASKGSGFFGSALPIAKGSSATTGPLSPPRSRKGSVSSVAGPGINASENSGRAGGHSRNVSTSSIRSAIQLPGSLMKGKGRARKDSISGPTPLASPFDIDRGNGENGYSMGTAI